MERFLLSHRPRKTSLSSVIDRILVEKEQHKTLVRQPFYSCIASRNGGIAGPREISGDPGRPREIPGDPGRPREDPPEVQANANDSACHPTNGKLSPVDGGQTSPREDDSSSGNRDEEDEPDEDEENDDKDDAKFDPERLKAFNMFVRLFVDENLDRIVPISKQPKEKIQAIIDSCTRQFPEFAERARKRLRTYLKSCRRNKRSRELAGLDGARAARPTPPHLTSVQAEQILAQACENETQNAKRMRLGLEPISQPLTAPANSQQVTTTAGDRGATYETAARTERRPLSSAAPQSDRPQQQQQQETQQQQQQLAAGFGPMLPAVLGAAAGLQLAASGGVPDLLRRPAAAPLPRAQLSAAEVAAVRQLVVGYRESASFLRRSADELELLIQQAGH